MGIVKKSKKKYSAHPGPAGPCMPLNPDSPRAQDLAGSLQRQAHPFPVKKQFDRPCPCLVVQGRPTPQPPALGSPQTTRLLGLSPPPTSRRQHTKQPNPASQNPRTLARPTIDELRRRRIRCTGSPTSPPPPSLTPPCPRSALALRRSSSPLTARARGCRRGCGSAAAAGRGGGCSAQRRPRAGAAMRRRRMRGAWAARPPRGGSGAGEGTLLWGASSSSPSLASARAT
jgi:hypothetical protein